MFLFGSNSSESEMPRAGVLLYDGMMESTHPDYDKLGSSTGYYGKATLSVDFGAGTIHAVFPVETLVGVNGVFKKDIFTITGTVTSNARMAGDIVSANGQLSGKVFGTFFGPNGSQFGFLFRLFNPSDPKQPNVIGYALAGTR